MSGPSDVLAYLNRRAHRDAAAKTTRDLMRRTRVFSQGIFNATVHAPIEPRRCKRAMAAQRSDADDRALQSGEKSVRAWSGLAPLVGRLGARLLRAFGPAVGPRRRVFFWEPP